MRGHAWTLLPHLVDTLRPPKTPGQAWTTALDDVRFGSIRLSGLLDELPEATSIVVIVHGMGSSAEQSYVVRAAQAARRQGLSSLRLTLRGCDGTGEDIYHAGLIDDLQAAIACSELAAYETIHVMGFSLGGHMVMRYALDPDSRVRSAAALCSPVDLASASRYIDSPKQLIYKRHLLAGLRRNAWLVEKRRALRLSTIELAAIRTIREWDDRVVAPRFGFQGVDEYHAKVTVAPHLGDLAIPTLLVFAERDPMLSAADLRPFLEKVSSQTAIRWMPGGHVRFPASTNAVDDAMCWLKSYA